MSRVLAVGAFAVVFSSLSALAQTTQQQTFTSPGRASHALVEAVKADDQAKLLALFGPAGEPLISSGDPEEDKEGRQQFVQKYEQAHRLVKEPDGTVVLYLGAENWPFPIPLVEGPNGAWHFDTAAGEQEILLRRIGKNELSAIEVCNELVAAEKEHYAGAHSGEAGQYASKLAADSGRHNGLYHPTENGRPEIGPLLAQAAGEGPGEATPFHGYYFRILTAQGNHALGGARSYIQDGKMTGGFAFVAYPAQYRSTGVMTFIVNQDGTVYEEDLGSNTIAAAKSIQAFDPDSNWKPVQNQPD
jgi:hypothetical protein